MCNNKEPIVFDQGQHSMINPDNNPDLRYIGQEWCALRGEHGLQDHVIVNALDGPLILCKVYLSVSEPVGQRVVVPVTRNQLEVVW